MPYSKISEAPANIRKLDGATLTLAQVNWIARVADGIPKGQVDNPWAVAISKFKKSFVIKDGKWMKKTKESKERGKDSGGADMCVCPKCNTTTKHTKGTPCTDTKCPKCGATMIGGDSISVEKQIDGRYKIVAVSTVALPDQEDETFSTMAMDYEIKQVEEDKEYPEFRVFHHKGLGVGKVTEMARVGIFAVDTGYSYDDAFSLSVCEKMLQENVDGKWKVSRGFRVFEIAGTCPDCGEELVVGLKHMVVGYRCPTCGVVNLNYKGVLKDIRFRKTRTFDITITDVPAVLYTGVQAYPVNIKQLEVVMDKQLIRAKLVEAGLDEAMVDERLKNVSDDFLKALEKESLDFTIPEAIVLKELLDEKPVAKSDEPDESILEMDDATLKQLAEAVGVVVRGIVQEEVTKALDGVSIEIGGMEDVELEVKELPQIKELIEQVKELSEAVAGLTMSEDDRLKQLLGDAPRNARLRIKRFKSTKEDDDEEDAKDDEDEDGVTDADGKKYKSMSAFVAPRGGN